MPTVQDFCSRSVKISEDETSKDLRERVKDFHLDVLNMYQFQS